MDFLICLVGVRDAQCLQEKKKRGCDLATFRKQLKEKEVKGA